MNKLLLTTGLLASGFAFAIMDGMKMPAMPGMDMPDMQGMKMPAMPGMDMPDMQGMKMPGMQGMDMPDMQGMKMPGMQGMKMPGMQGMKMPGMKMDSMTEEGKELHDQSSCLRCHGSEMYTRDDRKVQDYSDLKRQVSFCSNNLSTGWFPEEEELVVDFLNKTYYQHKK
jgi:hypothetical protein